MHNPCTKIEKKTETTEITKISNSFSIFPRIAREPRVNKTLRLCPRPARRLFISQFRIRCKGKKTLLSLYDSSNMFQMMRIIVS